MKDIIKNILLTTILIFCFLGMGKAQRFGVGLTYLNDFGFQARSVIEVENFKLIPKASYYIVKNNTSISLEIDAAYDLITVGDEIPIYLFAGPILLRSTPGGISDSRLGFNLGAGVEISQIYGELKYSFVFCEGCGGGIGLAGGYMF